MTYEGYVHLLEELVGYPSYPEYEENTNEAKGMNRRGEVKAATVTKTQQRIIEAISKGYFVTEDGKLYGPKGQLKVSIGGSQRYPTFSTNWGGYVYGIPVHKFAAYVFYGEQSFENNVVVRHLNGNTLDFSKLNLLLGTHSENNMDKSPSVRVASAKAARASQGKRPLNAKLTDEDVEYIKEFYRGLAGRKAPNGQ